MQLNDILIKPFLKIILSNKKDKSFAYNKAVVVPVLLKGKQAWQITLYTDKQAFQENFTTLPELKTRIQELFETKYKQLNFFGSDKDIEIKISKKGKFLISEQKHKSIDIKTSEHNRIKNRILKENEKIPPLIDIGIMTQDGKIIHSQMDKFRQINKFLEMVDDTLKNWKKILLQLLISAAENRI